MDIVEYRRDRRILGRSDRYDRTGSVAQAASVASASPAISSLRGAAGAVAIPSPRLLFLGNTQFAQAGEIHALVQRADLRRSPIAGDLHVGNRRYPHLAAQPVGFREFFCAALRLAVER